MISRARKQYTVPFWQGLVLRGQESALAGLAQIDSQQRHMLSAASQLWDLAQRNAAALGSAQQQHNTVQQTMLRDLRYLPKPVPYSSEFHESDSAPEVIASSIRPTCAKALNECGTLNALRRFN